MGLPQLVLLLPGCRHSPGRQCHLDHSLTHSSEVHLLHIPPPDPGRRKGKLSDRRTGPFLLIPSPNRNLCRPFPAFGAPSRKPSPCLCAHKGRQLQMARSCPGTVARKMSCWRLLLESGTDFPIKTITLDDLRF